jgi:hypothetical protein
MKRILSPATNPAGLTAAISALYALGMGIWNVVHHRGAIDPQVIVAAVTAVAALYTRQVVTPVADPHDGAGRALKTAEEHGQEYLIGALARTATSQALADSTRKPAAQTSTTPDVGSTP